MHAPGSIHSPGRREIPRRARKLLFGAGIALATSSSLAGEATDFLELDLEQLMQVEVFSASLLPQSRELAPALISVVSAEDIQLMGLRNLAELLDYLPEMQALSGINSARTLSVRGTSSCCTSAK